MHLSHENDTKSREPLWRYAHDKNRIGLDHYIINEDWFTITSHKKGALKRQNPQWPGQFKLFCEEMKKGDIILAMKGKTHLLGVGQAEDPYRFKVSGIKISKDYNFFRHQRPIHWVIKNEYEKAKSFKINYGRFTILHVNHKKPLWSSLVRHELGFIPPTEIKQFDIKVKTAEEKAAKEGEQYKKEALFRKRNRQLIEVKKASSNYRCEVCAMRFDERYGKIGEEYIIAHHKVPIGSRKGSYKIRSEDIALVCSNCHDMLHKKDQLHPMPIKRLKIIYQRLQ